ncbi:MAG: DUF3108 domain-containing protein, partial [Candidatus Krumholzibacteria bacterium]|nr:DUF3108 domain-containing protein [Candidatus Krumholzibacteria bacterium]
LKPVKLDYTAMAAIGGQDIEIGLAFELSKAVRGGRNIWRLITAQTSDMGSAVDTFDVDQASLLPLYRGIKQGGTTVKLDFSETEIVGKMAMGANEMPLTTKLDAPVYGSDAALELVMIALPLAPGYKTSLRTFDILTQSVKVMSLEVTGIENVTVPAGTFEAYKIELRDMSGEPGGGTIYIGTGAVRQVVRSVMQLPAMMGGGTITTDLKAVK